jgi:hypothetical protein
VAPRWSHPSPNRRADKTIIIPRHDGNGRSQIIKCVAVGGDALKAGRVSSRNRIRSSRLVELAGGDCACERRPEIDGGWRVTVPNWENGKLCWDPNLHGISDLAAQVRGSISIAFVLPGTSDFRALPQRSRPDDVVLLDGWREPPLVHHVALQFDDLIR